MPAKKKRTRNIEFDEYIPLSTSNPHTVDAVTTQEHHTHYELHGHAVHSTLSVPVSPPLHPLPVATPNIEDDMQMTMLDEYEQRPVQLSMEDDEYEEDDTCALEAQGLGNFLAEPIFLQGSDVRQKRRRTQAVC